MDVYVKGEGGGDGLHTLGVVTERGGTMAWSGIDAAAGGLMDLETVSIRQGAQVWRAGLHSLSSQRGLCASRVHGDFPLPVLPWRRSNTLALGDRLLYATAGVQSGSPRLAWTELIDVSRWGDKPHERAYIWLTRLDVGMPREYAFAFDGEGRVAGLLEPLPQIPSLAALLAGEWVGCLLQCGWVDMLLRTGSHEKPDFYEAEALCGIGIALHKVGDAPGALDAWTRATARDPLNPWPHRALGSLLVQDLDRFEEAHAHFRRAEELEAQEPPEGPQATDDWSSMFTPRQRRAGFNLLPSLGGSQ